MVEQATDDPARITLQSPIELAEALLTPACILDARTGATHPNGAWRALAGLAPGEAPALAALVHPEDLALLSPDAGTAPPSPAECRLRSADGDWRWFLLQAHPLPDACLWTATDIHRRRRRERERERLAALQAAMLDVTVDCIKLVSPGGDLVHMNRAGCEALGVAADSGFGMPWLSLLPEDVRAAGEQALATARAGRPSRFAGSSIAPGEPIRRWDNALTPVIGADGGVDAIVCISRDVTTERDALASLEESGERLQIAARLGGLGIWDYDIGRDELHCDAHWYRIMGRDPGRPIRSIADFRPMIHPEDRDRATEINQTARELISGHRDYAIEFRILRPDGEVRWVRSAAYLQHRDGAPTRATGFVVDITDARRGELALRDANRALEEEKTSLARQSLEDPLTGIANRRHLDGELARICAHAGETGAPLCIGMIDIDHFKAFNDRYGHPEADRVLRLVAHAIQDAIRRTDFVARYGGEEFALVLTGMHDPVPTIQRIFAAVRALGVAHAGAPGGQLTVSCGCVAFPAGDARGPLQRLEAADRLLYEAKRAGRDRYLVRQD